MAEVATKPKNKTIKAPAKYIFRLVNENDPNMAKYLGRYEKYPPYVSIPAEDTIYYDGNLVNIRYIPGVQSIFVEEQTEKLKVPQNVIDRAPKSIAFSKGYLEVPAGNKQLLKFLELTNGNERCKNRVQGKPIVFTIISEVEDAQKELELLDKQEEAILIARDLKDEEVMVLSKFLGVPFINYLDGSERDISLIRKDLRKKAIGEPVTFIDAYNNPATNTAYLVKLGIEKNIISLGRTAGKAVWASSGKVILDIPQGSDAESLLVDFCYTEQGADFLVALKHAIK